MCIRDSRLSSQCRRAVPFRIDSGIAFSQPQRRPRARVFRGWSHGGSDHRIGQDREFARGFASVSYTHLRAVLAAFAERGIRFVKDSLVRALDPGRKVAVLSDGTELPYELFLGVPVHRVPAVVVESGLALDAFNWVPVNKKTLETAFPGVYAVGDVNGVGTPKAGVFAEGAARVVAAAIIAQVRGGPPPEGYRGCLLYTSGAVGGAAARACHSHVARGEPVAAGTATAGGKHGSVDGGRGDRAVDHFLVRGNVPEVPTVDGFSHLAGDSRGPRCALGDDGDLATHRRDFRDPAGAAGFERCARGGVERGRGQHIGRPQEGAAGERAGGGANFPFAAAAGLRGIVYPQLHELSLIHI